MRTIAHLSDLKVGSTDPKMLEALPDLLVRLQPNVVVVAGNLTHSGQAGELRNARTLLDSMPSPQIVVPGDRDFGNSRFNRLLSTSASFFTAIESKTTPCFADSEIVVVGADMSKATQVKHGGRDEAGQKQIDQLFETADAKALHLLVACRPGFAMDERVTRRLDVVLAGEIDPQDPSCEGLLPTVIYTQDWNEGLAFNFLRLSAQEVVIERYGWKEAHAEFRLLGSDTRALSEAKRSA
jgi:hypothetical protein